MNAQQWLSELAEAYRDHGRDFTPELSSLLMSQKPTNPTEQQKQTLSLATTILFGRILRRATEKSGFGPIEKVKSQFGRTLEENYGVSTGPFYDVARAYWTFKLEMDDIARPSVNPEVRNLAMTAVVHSAEMQFGSVFFPTPGPATMPVKARELAQRQFLKSCAPEIDADRFVSDSPILQGRTSGRRSGCAGLVLITSIAATLLALAAVLGGRLL